MSLYGDNRLSLEDYFSKENNNNKTLYISSTNKDILSAIKQLIEMDQLVLNSGKKIDKTKVILSLQI